MATKNDSLLPGSDTELDVSNLRVNFTDDEASSEAPDFSPIPSGKYLVAITEVEVAYSQSEKHNGKPYWKVTMVIQEGPYENRRLWANVMLFEGALYSLAQLLKATGHEDALKSGKIPSGDSFVGEQVIVSVVKTLDKYRMDQNDDGEKVFKNEVKGFKPAADFAAAGSSSLLPG